ncbi:unnamed protein product [Strongylus vulgaris]|uniref:Uncharacterized protein n=1 Tax=Strongylus vulgaris TaxID=40348 RepID=A0A3P7KVT0_STRVU|nr:unnamed protein product [Strongylus vulgaris]
MFSVFSKKKRKNGLAAKGNKSPVLILFIAFFGLELLVGDLPWKYILKGDEVKRAKLELQHGDPQTSFLALTSDSFQEFARAVFSINTEEEPNYAALQALLTELVGDRRMSDPYDWEISYREAIEGVR